MFDPSIDAALILLLCGQPQHVAANAYSALRPVGELTKYPLPRPLLPYARKQAPIVQLVPPHILAARHLTSTVVIVTITVIVATVAAAAIAKTTITMIAASTILQAATAVVQDSIPFGADGVCCFIAVDRACAQSARSVCGKSLSPLKIDR